MRNYVGHGSDTVIKPAPEMREAIKNAVEADDILRDDHAVIVFVTGTRRHGPCRGNGAGYRPGCVSIRPGTV